ncbi:acyltransferase family protein [Undibacterium sp. Di24W]|uniref:acyltransferase family protein n=1 Tax=Undibacterium sp. Di24W TaxID=3413033 RepID=UPI003BF3A9EC
MLEVKSPQRFLSVDALRGLSVAAMLLVNSAGDWDHVYPWLEHASWHGVTPADFIFPFFLFIVGVSLYLALTPKLEKNLANGLSNSVLARVVMWRGARIIALGVFLHLIAYALIPGREFRLMGVLQRIGLCFIFAGLLLIYVRRFSALAIISGAILLFYWGLLSLAGSYEPHINLVDQIDSRVLGKLAYSFDARTGLAQEPEGLLSTIPALVSVLLGVFAGTLLRTGQTQRLLQFAIFFAILAWTWSFYFPMNKQLWTSSFVLCTTSFACVALWLAHRLIDQAQWPAIGISFGINAIAAYAGSWILTCILAGTGWMSPFYQRYFAANLVSIWGAEFSSFIFAASFTGFFAVLMFVLRKVGWRFSI